MVGAVLVWAPPKADPDTGRGGSSFGDHIGVSGGFRRGQEGGER